MVTFYGVLGGGGSICKCSVLLSACGSDNVWIKLHGPLSSLSTQIDLSCLSFEGHQFQGKKAIMDKLNVSSCRCPPQQQRRRCRTVFPIGGGAGANKPSALLVAAISHDKPGRSSCFRVVVLIFSSFCAAPESSFHKDRAYYNSTGPPADSRPVHREYGGRTAEGRCTSSPPVNLTFMAAKLS